MRKVYASLFLLMLNLLPSLAWAQDGAEATSKVVSWGTYLGAGIAIGLAVIGGGLGMGRAAAAAYESIGRQPAAADKVFVPLLLGLALIEFQTIMAFIIALLLVL